MQFFGHGKDLPIVKSVLENEYLRVETLNLRACVKNFIDKKSGKDIVLGFPTLRGYWQYPNLAGCAYYFKGINGVITSDWQDKIYHVKEEKNKITYYTKLANRKLSITYLLKDYNLLCFFTYKLKNKENIKITNNIYFNLLGSVGRTILAHQLNIDTLFIGMNEKDKKEIKDSVFDFYKGNKIGLNLLKSSSSINYNHPYLFNDSGYRASIKTNDLRLSIYSDLKLMYLKTLNEACLSEGKNHITYGEKDGIAFLCQDLLASKDDDIYKHYICYNLN